MRILSTAYPISPELSSILLITPRWRKYVGAGQAGKSYFVPINLLKGVKRARIHPSTHWSGFVIPDQVCRGFAIPIRNPTRIRRSATHLVRDYKSGLTWKKILYSYVFPPHGRGAAACEV